MNIFEITLPSPSHTTLLESVCRDLTRDQRRVVEGIVNQLRPLFEAPLTQTQIDQIFSQAEQNLTGAGVNRSGAGRAVDVTKAVGSAVGSKVGSVNNAINKLGGYLQTTAPVQYFDQKFEDLKQKISAKLGADSKTMAIVDQLGQYAKANPGKTAFVIGALTAVAAFAAGPAGGAVAGQVLRGAVELLKGEKLSTAVGKGIKTAAFGYLTGSVLDAIGDWFRSWTMNMVQYTPEIRKAEFGWSETINFSKEDLARVSRPGMELLSASSTEAENLAGYFRNADADRLSQLAKTFNSTGNPTAKIQAWDEFRKIFAKCTEPGYFEGAVVDDNTARQLAIANDKLYQTTVKMTKGIAAAAQGAVQAATGTGAAKTAPAQPTAAAPATPVANAAPAAKTPTAGTATNQVREHHIRLTNKEVKEIFAVAGNSLNEGPLDWLKTKGKNITTKVTADKLSKIWKDEGKPMDSEQIALILDQAGVSKIVIASTFDAVKAPVPSWIRTPAAAEPVAVEPAATRDQGADVFGNMAQTLKTMQPPDTTSTGGSVTQTPTGLKHTAKTAGKTAQPDTATAQAAAPDAAQIIANLEKTVPKDVLMSVAAELLKKYTSRATPK